MSEGVGWSTAQDGLGAGRTSEWEGVSALSMYTCYAELQQLVSQDDWA